jgi:hypothetical protein
MQFAHGGSGPDRGHRPCYRVTIQTDRVNESELRQNCDRNVSRTAQVGARNRAQTVQRGSVNNNKVRQYNFDGFRRFDRRRPN